uniref:Centromere protein J C-terminal domain-containing protein n=1 Tax=Eutreptiella gymnastica TaxID=73025 RepID=A0A7S1IQZ5_9EUGL|mmetsp:Transcript_34991/g.62536  ORF Transcript_34991/g.62536 Transcript_34991/m.62536 type:complete len:588 (+) Transcript_34991:20-1783(+)
MNKEEERARRRIMEDLKDKVLAYQTEAEAEVKSGRSLIARADVTKAQAKMALSRAVKAAGHKPEGSMVGSDASGSVMERHPDGTILKRMGDLVVVLLEGDTSVQLRGPTADSEAGYGEIIVQSGAKGAGEQVAFCDDSPGEVNWSAQKGGRVCWRADGIVLTQLPNGTNLQVDANKVLVRPEQGMLADAIVGVLPKEECIMHLPDGLKVHLSCDGVLVAQTADGQISELYPDGRIMNKCTLSDGFKAASEKVAPAPAPKPKPAKRCGGGFIPPPKPAPQAKEKKVTGSAIKGLKIDADAERKRLRELKVLVEGRADTARFILKAATIARDQATGHRSKALEVREQTMKMLTAPRPEGVRMGQTEQGDEVEVHPNGCKVQRQIRGTKEKIVVVLADDTVCQLSGVKGRLPADYAEALVQFPDDKAGQVIWAVDGDSSEGALLCQWATLQGANVQFRDQGQLTMVKTKEGIVQFEKVQQFEPPLQRATVIQGEEAVQLMEDPQDPYALISLNDGRKVQVGDGGFIIEQRADGGASRLEGNGDIAVKNADGSMWRMQGSDLYTSSAECSIRSPMGQAKRLDAALNSPADP